MAYIVLGYGMHLEDNHTFIEQHEELIDQIIDQDKRKNWKQKIIVTIGGGNWDVSFLIGIGIRTIEYTATSLIELNEIFLKEDYKSQFLERLAQYPELQVALEPYMDKLNFQIILDRE